MGGLSLGPLALSADRAGVLAGVLVLLLAAWVLGRRAGQSGARRLADWATAAVLTAGLAARAGFVAAHHDVFAAEPLTALAVWQGGFSPAAGAAGFAAASAWYLARARALAVPAAFATALALTTGVALRAATTGTPAALPAGLMLRTLDGQPAPPGPGPVVINLWASWCPPCRREMPMLAEEAARAAGVRILFVNQGEGAAAIRRYLAREGIVLAPLLDPDGRMLRHFGMQGLPATLFIGADGRLRRAHMGEISRAGLRAGIAGLHD